MLKLDISLDGTVIENATQITRYVTEACNVTMLRRRLLASSQPYYFWKNEIATSFRASRLHQRHREKPGSGGRDEIHWQLRDRLKEAIRLQAAE